MIKHPIVDMVLTLLWSRVGGGLIGQVSICLFEAVACVLKIAADR